MTKIRSALLFTLAAVSARAQTAVGPEFRVNEFTTGHQRYPSVASDAAGNFVVVWMSEGQDGSYSGIFGRRFDAAGNPRGGEFQVNSATTDIQEIPQVASDAAGNFVVVWKSQPGPYQDVIVGRLFDPGGAPVTPDFAVNTYELAFHSRQRVAFTGTGGFVAVWASYDQDGNGPGVFGQRFDRAGSRLGAEFQVNTYTTGRQYIPDVAGDGAGNFVVVWQDNTQEGYPNAGIFAQRFDAAGQRVGSEFHVNTATLGPQVVPAVAVERAGAFAVIWSGPQLMTNVWGQRYDASGTAVGGEFRVNSALSAGQRYPVLAVDANGNTVAAWTGFDSDNSGVGARRFDCDWQPQGPDLAVNTYTTGIQNDPAVAAQPGGFVVVWRSKLQDGSLDGVFAQRFRVAETCGRFHTVTPCRVADTRNPPGPSGGPPLGANTTREFPVGGACGIPADARAVALNVTAVNATDLGNLRVFPAGEPVPVASAVNFVAGRTRANNAIALLGTGGRLGVRCDMPVGSTGATNVVLDVYGYFR